MVDFEIPGGSKLQHYNWGAKSKRPGHLPDTARQKMKSDAWSFIWHEYGSGLSELYIKLTCSQKLRSESDATPRLCAEQLSSMPELPKWT